jgi:hypothetical protein
MLLFVDAVVLVVRRAGRPGLVNDAVRAVDVARALLLLALHSVVEDVDVSAVEMRRGKFGYCPLGKSTQMYS